MDDEPGDGRRFVVGQVPLQGAVEIADRNAAIDVDRAVGLRPHARHRDVVLIGDVADDFLQNVLERDQPHHLTVFVDHQREMRLPTPESFELLGQRADVGHEPGRPRNGGDVDFGKIAVRDLDRTQEVLGVQDADDVLGLSLPQRHPRDLRFQHRLDHLLGRVVGANRDHLGAVDHDVGDGEIAQIQKPAEHVAVEPLDAARPVQKIERSPQFLMGRKNRFDFPDLHAGQPQHPLHEPFDRDQDRREHPDRPIDRARNGKRNAVGRVEGRGLRQDLGEHHDHDGHDDGGIDNTHLAEPGEQHAGRERGSRDVDGVVAE